MSTIYTLHLPASVGVTAPMEFVTAALGTRRTGLIFWEDDLDERDIQDSAEDDVFYDINESLVGERLTVGVTFQLKGGGARRDFPDMIATSLAFLTTHPDVPGFFAFNGEVILFQRLPGGELMLDESWREYAAEDDDPDLDAVAGALPVRRLEQAWL